MPSPATNPSRSVSNGREAVSGLSFLLDSACDALNPPIDAGVMDASEPPAITRSALPNLIRSNAFMMAVFDEAQAETVQ